MKNKINILGTDYTVNIVKMEDDNKLKEYDGYCDNSTKKIVLRDLDKEPVTIGNLEAYKNGVLRHETIHAFIFESGLQAECPFANDEICVDWIALQAPKMFKLWQEMGIL